MFTVDRCCCCALETGGLILGWFYGILYLIGTVVSPLGFVGIFLVNCKELREAIEKDVGSFDYSCGAIKGVVAVFTLITLAICIGCLYCSYLLVTGVKKRDASRVKPMMVLMAIASICAFLGLLNFRKETALSSIFGGVLYGYFFVVLFSLAEMFRSERERGFNSQYHAPGAKV
ncbi:CLUMA_CG019461, isoform A [Clunio marinus]|uniref:CLUMA_CG019461, isoform A n=1 Tax=Clunio marinus TaxID=568069 RepID=A0A1J1J5U0_9DIPT|nr:CLUMA_CG019461, isoform A [Clunio marinus]